MTRETKEIEYKEANVAELSQRLQKTQQDLFKARFRAAAAPLKNTMQIRKLRREIARLNTFIHQRRQEG